MSTEWLSARAEHSSFMSVSDGERVMRERCLALTDDDWSAIARFECSSDTLAKVMEIFPRSTIKDDAVFKKKLPNPAFTMMVEGKIPVAPLFVREDFWGLINAQSPFPKSYPPEDGGATASGSLFHLLVVPTRRVYNAVSLAVYHLPMLLAMRDEALRVLGTAPSEELVNRTKSAMVAKLVSFGANKETVERWEACFDTMLEDFLKLNKPIEWGFFFHLHPDHTVGHLHLHVFPLNKDLRTNHIHDSKCVPLDSVLSMLKRREAKATMLAL